MKRMLLLILAAPMALLAGPHPAAAQQVYWFDAAFSAPTLSRANPNGSSLQTISLASKSLPQGLDFDVTGAMVLGSELSYSGAHLNNGSVNLVGYAPLVSGLSCVRGVAVDGPAGMVYWSSTNLVTGAMVQRAHLDGTAVQTLYSVGPGGGCAPRGLALDVADGMLFIADFDAGKIQKVQLGGGSPVDVMTGLNGPSGIAIDPLAGRMYWTEANANTIRSANLDGTSPLTLVSGLATPNYIALDLTGQRMYWTEIGTPRIQSAGMNGSGVQQLPANVSEPSGIGFLPVNTTPVAVADLFAEPAQGSVDVHWSAFLDGPTVFEVQRSERRDGNYTAVSPRIDAAGKTAFSFVDQSARPGTEYFYKVGYLTAGAWHFTGAIRIQTPAAIFALSAPSPNPSRGPVRLGFELASRGPVSLEIFDPAGRRVRTLVSANMEAGLGSAEWDGRSSSGEPVATGTYFARLSSGGKVAHRRLVVMK